VYNIKVIIRERIFFQGKVSYIQVSFLSSIFRLRDTNFHSQGLPALVTQFGKQGSGSAANVENAAWFKPVKIHVSKGE
jgi:hypothetical protein